MHVSPKSGVISPFCSDQHGTFVELYFKINPERCSHMRYGIMIKETSLPLKELSSILTRIL